MVKFEKNGIMKPKIYLFDCIVRGKDCQPIIIIINDKCTFFTNDKIQKA